MTTTVEQDQSKHADAFGQLRYDADGSFVFPGATGVRKPITFDNIAQDATPFCGEHHRHPSDVAGYAIALTRAGHGRVRDLVVYDDPRRYGEVVELAGEIREALNEIPGDEFRSTYARIDVLYADGCRGIL